ncbi:MAG: hypothetical protein JXA44_12680 [Methanospirillaceae archaeon]|nr:hypothetical protein [Methanospirillaceae archaeon]
MNIHIPVYTAHKKEIIGIFSLMLITTLLIIPVFAAEPEEMESISDLNQEIFGVVPFHMNNPDFWFEYGVKSMLIGEDEKALVAFANVLELDPGNAAAWDNLGRIFNRMGLAEAGKTSIETSEEIDPTGGDLYRKKIGDLADIIYEPVLPARPGKEEEKEPFETEEKIDLSKHPDPNGPDLRIDTMKAVRGSSIPGILTETEISNTGKADSGSFYLTYYLSPDNRITPEDIPIGFRFFKNIPIGEREFFTGSLKIPHVSPGDYYVGAIADPTNTVMEISENNNSRSSTAPITILGFNEQLQAYGAHYSPLEVADTYTESVGGPDLIVVDISHPSIATAGDTITVETSVRNQGSDPAPSATANLYISDNLIFDEENDILLGSGSVEPLSPGMQSDGIALVEIPKTLTKGIYYLCMVLDENDAIAESVEKNNVLFGNRIIIKRYYG